MEFDKDEEKIKSLLRAYSGKPPEDLMKNYVAEVRKKIQSAPGQSWGLGLPAVLFLVALSLLAAFVLMKPAHHQAVVPQSAVKEEVQPEATPQETAPAAAPQPEDFEKLLQQVEDQADFEELSDSLMVLELLGEDAGLMDDSGTVEADVEFFTRG